VNSALYAGHVQHRRLRPRLHHLRYSFFWTLLDLDELADVSRRCRLFSAEKFNLFSFYQGDHLGPGGDLRGQMNAILEQAKIPAGGAIRVMCMPRVLGHVFNPISVFFCYDATDALAAILYEVNNTFGQRHCYLFAVRAGRVISHGCAKEFYVSPFMAMQMRYEFEVTEPGAHQTLKINGFDDAGLMIATSFAGTRRELSDGVLIGSFFTHPLLTLKVVAGIHIEALRLWLKGVRIVPRPKPPAQLVTFVQNSNVRG